MKQAVREIESMTEGLESAGFDRRQSNAMIHAIANAIDKFAMTPERMREALERNNDILMERVEKRMDERFALQNQLMEAGFEAQNKLMDERFVAERRINDERFRHQDKRLDAIEASIKTGLGRLFALGVALSSAVVGVLVRVVWF
ncbi:MAG: hypothetical protein F4X31_02775 [Gammaproteobacteria bacterium]|nr:hypothetical protein [Gammaproteobacteria bacterium]